MLYKHQFVILFEMSFLIAIEGVQFRCPASGDIVSASTLDLEVMEEVVSYESSPDCEIDLTAGFSCPCGEQHILGIYNSRVY